MNNEKNTNRVKKQKCDKSNEKDQNQSDVIKAKSNNKLNRTVSSPVNPSGLSNPFEKSDVFNRFLHSGGDNSISNREPIVRAKTPDKISSTLQNKSTLDVWEQTQCIFAPIPSEEKLDQLFSIELQPMSNTTVKSHWLSKLQDIVNNTRMMSNNVSIENAGDIIRLNEGKASYWKSNIPSFSLNKSLQDNQIVSQRILSSLVPERGKKESKKLDEEYKVRESVPIIDNGGYLSLSFESKAKLELKCLDLLDDDNDFLVDTQFNCFSSKISELKEKMRVLEPELIKQRKELDSKYDTIRIEDMKIRQMQNTFDSVFQSAKKKTSRKS